MPSTFSLRIFALHFNFLWWVALLPLCSTCMAQESKVSGDSWSAISAYFEIPKPFDLPSTTNSPTVSYRSPLIFQDGRKVANARDWVRRREEIRESWDSLLGRWPKVIEDPQVVVLGSSKRENFTQHQVRFRWTPNEETTGYLLIPDAATAAAPRPAVLTVFYEPETAIGLGKPNRDFAIQLARRGFVTLSIGTTKATQARTYALYYPSLDDAQVQPLSMLGYAAANAWNVLASRPEVDDSRIGIVGHSFGGKWAMFASCLYDRFACAVWSDPGIVFDESRPSVNYWEPWYLGYHPKPWRKRGIISKENPAQGLYPKLREQGRDLHELHALMAPRPFFVSGGSEDPPKRWQALLHSIEVNKILGFENRVAMSNRPKHDPNPESNEIIYKFFEHFLAP
ncbi:MAG: acyl-CoA thioester hydrolase/BAAT C-terminal domain-containing protein [Planctomycetota bacterium]